MEIEVNNYTSTRKVTINVDTFDKTLIDISSDSNIEVPSIPKRIVDFYLKQLRSKAIKIEHNNDKTFSLYVDILLDRFFNLSFIALLYVLGIILFIIAFIIGSNTVKILDICLLFTVINISVLLKSKNNRNDFEFMKVITLDFYKRFSSSHNLDYNINLQNPYIACNEMSRFIKLPLKITADELKVMKQMYMYFEAYAEINKGYLKYGLNYTKYFLIEI